MCEALAELTPGDHAKKAALFNSGAEAVENAVKVARYATGRTAVVAVDHAYHGRTNLTMALTAKAMPYKQGFGPFASDVYRVPTSYPFRDPEGMTGEQAAARAIGDGREAGRRRPDRRARHRADPGRGRLRRTGPWLPPGAAGVVQRERHRARSPTRCRPGSPAPAPGSPASTRASSPTWSPSPRASPAGCRSRRVTGRAEMMDAVHAGGLGGTYGGNPVACAAALGAIETMREEDLLGAAQRIEAPGQGPPAGHRRQGARHRRHPRARWHARDRVGASRARPSRTPS